MATDRQNDCLKTSAEPDFRIFLLSDPPLTSKNRLPSDMQWSDLSSILEEHQQPLPDVIFKGTLNI